MTVLNIYQPNPILIIKARRFEALAIVLLFLLLCSVIVRVMTFTAGGDLFCYGVSVLFDCDFYSCEACQCHTPELWVRV